MNDKTSIMTIMKSRIPLYIIFYMSIASCGVGNRTDEKSYASSAETTSKDAPDSFKPSAEWLVGTWVPRGIRCDQDATFMAFDGNGKWNSPAEEGAWRINGNKLIRRKTGKIGDYDEPVQAVDDDHDYKTVITAAKPGSFNGRNEAGQVIHWQRCPAQASSSPQETVNATEANGDVRERWQQFAWQGSVGASINSLNGSNVSLSCDDKTNEYGVAVTQSSVWIHPKKGELKGEMTANFIVDGRSHSLSITDGHPDLPRI